MSNKTMTNVVKELMQLRDLFAAQINAHGDVLKGEYYRRDPKMNMPQFCIYGGLAILALAQQRDNEQVWNLRFDPAQVANLASRMARSVLLAEQAKRSTTAASLALEDAAHRLYGGHHDGALYCADGKIAPQAINDVFGEKAVMKIIDNAIQHEMKKVRHD